MAKYDTKRRNSAVRNTRKSSGLIRQLGLVCVSFVCGYLTASFYDYTQLNAWVSTHVLATPPTVPVMGKQVMHDADLPKPKFEFYTLLTQDTRTGVPVVVSAPVATTLASTTQTSSQQPMDLTVTPTVVGPHAPGSSIPPSGSMPPSQPMSHVTTSSLPVVGATTGAYMVQLASFTRRQDAERMKASLIMKGFAVNIAAVSKQGTSWYRVVLGPFVSRLDAQRAQGAVARRVRIMGMIRKMDS